MIGRKEKWRGQLKHLLSSRPAEAYVVAPDRVLLCPRDGTPTRLIAKELHMLYERLTGFKTISEHIQSLHSGAPDASLAGWSGALIESGMHELSRLGLLISQKELLKRYMSEGGESAAERKGAKIEMLCWPTRGRPLALARSITGALQNAEKYGRSPGAYVYDDSSSTDRTLVKRLSSMARRTESPIGYCGREEKKHYLKELSAHSGLSTAQEEALAFAMFGDSLKDYSYGGNYNAILLGAAGTAAFCADDDAIFRYTGHPGKVGQQLLRVHQHEQLLTMQQYTTLGSALKESRFRDLDIIAEHETFLGRSLRSILSRRDGDRIDLSRMSDTMLASLMKKPDERVQLVLPGLVGDSGRPNNHMWLAAPDTLMKGRELEPEEFFSLLQSRVVQRSADAPVISSSSHFMATFFAVDNRYVVPPFFPTDHGHDGVFGAAFRFMNASGLIAYLPGKLIHAPLPHRGDYAEGLEIIHSRVSDILVRLIEYCSPQAENFPEEPEERLMLLGEYFIELSQLPVSRFTELVHEVNINAYARYVALLEERMDSATSVLQYLADTYASHVQAVQRYMQSDLSRVPSNLEGSAEQRNESLQRIIKQSGRLLQYWPALYEAARTASADGIHPWRVL